MPESPFEHFRHIDEVVAYIRQRLPNDVNSASWKNVCEDAFHCHLSTLEPILLKELERVRGLPSEENVIRGLLRAVSWATHPQLPVETLVAKLDQLAPYAANDVRTHFQTIREALMEKKDGFDAYPAALAIEAFRTCPIRPEDQTTINELRDQIYYQLLYPHWFEVMKQWTKLCL